MARPFFNEEQISVEAEAVTSIIDAPSSKYDKPVRVAIYFYGVAPSTSLNKEDDLRPEGPNLKYRPGILRRSARTRCKGAPCGFSVRK